MAFSAFYTKLFSRGTMIDKKECPIWPIVWPKLGGGVEEKLNPLFSQVKDKDTIVKNLVCVLKNIQTSLQSIFINSIWFNKDPAL